MAARRLNANEISSELDLSDTDDESSDQFSCDEYESSSEAEDDRMIDARDWIEEKTDAPSPAHPRFPFTELRHSGNVPQEGNPLDFFNLFFTDEIIQHIVDETNRYANQKVGAAFENTNSNEMRVFLSISMLQGIVMKPNYFLYWSKKPLVDTPFFRQCMPQKRFMLIKRFLHFSDNSTLNENTQQPKLNKIQHVFDYLREKFSSHFTLPRDVTIDESLMLWKGRLGWVQYMPLKRSRFGIKLYMLCDSNSGYVWDVIIYTGKGTFVNPAYKDNPVSTQIVMSLMHPLLEKGYCLTTDNWYTSPQLADLLIEHRTDTYGTVRQTRKDIPRPLKSKKLKKKGDCIAFRRGKVILMKWKDKKDVTLLSTVHSSAFIHQERFRQPDFQMPQIVKDYNLTMGGVDRADQSLSSYPIMRKRGKKYYRKIFFHLVELVVWNSYILYHKIEPKKKPLDFRMDLIDNLVSTYKIPEERIKRRPSMTDTPLRLSGRHFPSYVPETAKTPRPSRKCAVCAKKKDDRGKKIRRDTRFQCTECNVGLCIVPCFGDYHTKLDLSR